MATPFAALMKHLSALAEDAATRPGPCRNITEAAVRNEVSALRAFLDAGADIHERTIGFASPLHAAAAAGHMESVELLLARGASLAPPDAMFPILYFPAINHRLEIIERLLHAGAPREPQRIALLHVAKHRSWYVVDALIAGGLDPGWMPASAQASYAKWRKQQGPRDAKWLTAGRDEEARRRAHAVRRVLGKRRLSDDARESHESAALKLVEKHGNTLAGARLPSGTSLLAQAVTIRAPRLARALIAAGAEVDAADPGSAPLTRAAELGDVELMTLLLAAGASPAGAALVAAAGAGSLAGCDLLIARGAQLQASERKAARAAACGPNERQILDRLGAASSRKKRAS